MALPENYHRDWQRARALENPEWYKERLKQRGVKRKEAKTKAVEYMGSKCAHCGFSFPDCCYDFHHKDSSIVNDVPSAILHCSWKRIVEELDKCIMLCANCHRIVHNEEGYSAHAKRNKKKYEQA